MKSSNGIASKAGLVGSKAVVLTPAWLAEVAAICSVQGTVRTVNSCGQFLWSRGGQMQSASAARALVPAEQTASAGQPVMALSLTEPPGPSVQDMAVSVSQFLGNLNGTQLLTLTAKQIREYCLSVQQAPSIFKIQYNTTECFTWAMAGFNFYELSFFPGAQRSHENLLRFTARVLIDI